MPERRTEFEVALIGLGPTGAVLANLLGAAGHSVLVIEREQDIFPLPRAIHFDGEVFRIFQSLGLRAEVEAISRPGTQGMHFVNAQGETLLIRGGTAARGPHGCANNHYFHQPQLEAVLRQGLRRYPQVQVLLHHTLDEVATDAEGVTLRYRPTAGGEEQVARARYVVGCDGAKSLIRQTMGSPMVDLGLRQPWLVFDVILEQDVELPAYSVQHCDPRRPMTYCNVVGQRRRWEIMVLPEDDPQALLQPERLWQLVSGAIRPDQARLERAAIYTFHSVVAQGWRQGRLLLAGDACHQTPPFLGQGMCAGVRDAANLAWKLSAVLQGRAPEALLDTYESERRPHVTAMIELAVSLGEIIQTTDVEQAAARDAKFRSGEPQVFQLPPQQLGPGDYAVQADSPAGTPFPQPQLADGRWLDDVWGWRHAVLATPEVLESVPAATQAHWRQAGAALLPASEAGLQQWLQEHGCCAVVMRPDRYIVGVATSAADLERLSTHLPASQAQPEAAQAA